MGKPKLWTKDFLTDSMINFFVYLVYYLLVVTITVYAADNLQASPSEAGLASGIFILGALVARIFSGRAIAQVGQKKMLNLGLCFFLITTVLYFFTNNLFMLFIIRFLHGAGFGISATATATIIAGIIPNERRGEGTSYYAMSTTLASALGPFAGMYLNGKGNFNIILLFSVILLSLSFIAAFFLKVPKVQLTKEQANRNKSLTLSSFFETKAVPISIISVAIGFAFSSILSFLSTYSREIELLEAGSIFFMVYSVSILLSRPLTGRLFDRKGENFVMYPAFLLFAIGLLILAQARQAIPLLLAGVFVGFGYGTFVSSAQAIAIKVSPPHNMGLATSTFFSLLDGGVGMGPFFLGLIIPLSGYSGMYIVMAALAFACSFLYYFLHGREAGKCKDASCTSL